MIKRILILLILFIAIPVVFFSWWQQQTKPLDPARKESQMVVIPQGWGVDQIGNRLKTEGLIRNPLAFKLMVMKEGIAKKLQAGDFRLSPNMNLFEIAQTLTHGTLDAWITVPEGLRREEIANIIKNSLLKQEVEFDAQDFIDQSKKWEGMLFPDTYLIPKTASVAEIVKYFTDNFNKKFDPIKNNSGLTQKQVIILASLVEREAKHDKDRPIIAGILIKRLKKGWPLQVDATVQYAKASIINNQQSSASWRTSNDTNWWEPVNQQDVKTISSPYNTYINQNLPPTPICNPGLASLKATANPQESDYWFYISDNSGNIHYAQTIEEQEKNIKQYLTS